MSKFFKLITIIKLTTCVIILNTYLTAFNFNNIEIKENLAVKLFDIGAIKFRDFTFKSGLKSPIYIDLRTVISYPEILEELASIINNEIKNNKFDLICGVPLGALPLATSISLISKIPMIMVRNEVKDHGTKKNIEGFFEPEKNCLIIEDVITTGASILNTIQILKKENIVISEIITIMDWQQKGKENLAKKGYSVKSIFNVSELFNILYKHNKIDLKTLNQVDSFLKIKNLNNNNLNNTADKILTYGQRAQYCKNQIGKKLLELIEEKQTNLAVAVDVKTKKELLQLADDLGPEICLLKTHIDIIEDFDQDLTNQLYQLSQKHNFLILEDRKFSDIGAISAKQYNGGIYKINQWADIVTVQSVSGPGTIDALKSIKDNKTKEPACFLIAQMSSFGALTTDDYLKATLDIALKNPQTVVGLISQKKLTQDPSIIHATPGIQLENTSDNLGQQYITPQKAIANGSDIIIVGRGITQSNDPKKAAKTYRKVAWEEYKKNFNLTLKNLT